MFVEANIKGTNNIHPQYAHTRAYLVHNWHSFRLQCNPLFDSKVEFMASAPDEGDIKFSCHTLVDNTDITHKAKHIATVLTIIGGNLPPTPGWYYLAFCVVCRTVNVAGISTHAF